MAHVGGALFSDFGRRFLETTGEIFGARTYTCVLVVFVVEGCAEGQRITAVPSVIDERMQARRFSPVTSSHFCAIARALPMRT